MSLLRTPSPRALCPGSPPSSHVPGLIRAPEKAPLSTARPPTAGEAPALQLVGQKVPWGPRRSQRSTAGPRAPCRCCQPFTPMEQFPPKSLLRGRSLASQQCAPTPPGGHRSHQGQALLALAGVPKRAGKGRRLTECQALLLVASVTPLRKPVARPPLSQNRAQWLHPASACSPLRARPRRIAKPVRQTGRPGNGEE